VIVVEIDGNFSKKRNECLKDMSGKACKYGQEIIRKKFFSDFIEHAIEEGGCDACHRVLVEASKRARGEMGY